MSLTLTTKYCIQFWIFTVGNESPFLCMWESAVWTLWCVLDQYSCCPMDQTCFIPLINLRFRTKWEKICDDISLFQEIINWKNTRKFVLSNFTQCMVYVMSQSKSEPLFLTLVTSLLINKLFINMFMIWTSRNGFERTSKIQ